MFFFLVLILSILVTIELTDLKKSYWIYSKKKEALRDIAKIEKSQIFGLFENKASYEDFFTHKCFKSCYGYFV